MRAPVRPISGRWPKWLERRARRFFRVDPRLLLANGAEPAQFRAAMSLFHVGTTIKITGTNRHPDSDALLIGNVDTSEGRIVDIGASDGSTSVELIRKLHGFKSYVLADLYFFADVTRVGRYVIFYEANGTAILIAGPRVIAWPGLAGWVRHLYWPLTALAARRDRERDAALLLNPEARSIIADDPRVSFQVYDIFTPWPDGQVDVIKIANVLRRLYFSNEMITEALGVQLRNLVDGGHLLMIDNPRIDGIAERGGLYRRDNDRFVAVALTDDTPEVDDLITEVRLTAH